MAFLLLQVSGIVLDSGIREQLLAESSEELEHERQHIVFNKCRQNAVFLKAILVQGILQE
jgi:hypothetical protein